MANEHLTCWEPWRWVANKQTNKQNARWIQNRVESSGRPVDSVCPGGHVMSCPVTTATGNDHLVMLTAAGVVYTCGCGEQGQLGRVPELFADRGGRKGLGT